MTELPITLITASILGIMFIWLSARTILARFKHNALIGDMGNTEMTFAMRTHGNFTEYAPIFLILLGLLEFSAANSTALIALAAIFIVARLLHVPGMGQDANLKLRQAGIAGSFLAIAAASFYGLFIALS